MPKTREIVLSIGNRIGVLVKDLPKTLAEAIYPRATVSPLVSRIRGKLPDRVPLTPEDWNLLRSFWPSIQEVMPHREFCDFWAAFREWKDKPRWQVWSDDEGGDRFAGLRKDANEMFKAKIEEAIASGSLVPRNHAGIPTCPSVAGYTPGLAWIFPHELEAFAANFHIRVRSAELEESRSENGNTATPPINPSSPNLTNFSTNATASPACLEFRAMTSLKAAELSIAFVAGDSGTVILEISARKKTKRVALAALGLCDHRNGELNEQGAILLGMAKKRSIKTADQKMSRRVSRLRSVLKKHIGCRR